MINNIIILTIVLLPINFGFSQSLNWDLTNQDTTVLGGTVVEFYGYLTTDTLQAYECSAIAENVVFPTSWSFAICNPFLCASNNVTPVNFIYPDTVNQQIFNEGFGGSLVKLGVYTTASSTPEIGELDFKVKNHTLDDSLSAHIIVRTNGQSVGLEDSDFSTEVYFDPINKFIMVPEYLWEANYEIYDLNGSVVQQGTMRDKISYGELLSGHFVLKYTIENNISIFHFSLISG